MRVLVSARNKVRIHKNMRLEKVFPEDFSVPIYDSSSPD
jgi:hypothetical protein